MGSLLFHLLTDSAFLFPPFPPLPPNSLLYRRWGGRGFAVETEELEVVYKAILSGRITTVRVHALLGSYFLHELYDDHVLFKWITDTSIRAY